MEHPNPPYMLLATATCPIHQIQLFLWHHSHCLSSKHHVSASATAFCQWYIHMFQLSHTNQYTTIAVKHVTLFMQQHFTGSLVVFTNAALLSDKIHKKIEKEFSDNLLNIDALNVHGSMSLVDKFQYTSSFTGMPYLPSSTLNIYGTIGTASNDTGIDHHNLTDQVLCQTAWPDVIHAMKRLLIM